MDSMTEQESYAERRQLFKNIWKTAMDIDEKDANILTKPKVIKTLRLQGVDYCVVPKKKKQQRIKNLRTVCEKLLDFCDKQDEQIGLESLPLPHQKLESPTKKTKIHRGKKRIIKSKSLTSSKRIIIGVDEMKRSPSNSHITSKPVGSKSVVKNSVTTSVSFKQPLEEIECVSSNFHSVKPNSSILKRKHSKRKKNPVSPVKSPVTVRKSQRRYNSLAEYRQESGRMLRCPWVAVIEQDQTDGTLHCAWSDARLADYYLRFHSCSIAQNHRFIRHFY